MKVEAALGFAQVTGRLASGDMAVTRALRRGKVYLVIIAEDSGRRTVRRYRHLCEALGVPWRRWGSKVELGRLLGRPARSVVGVLDPDFALRLQEVLPAHEEGSGSR